MFYIHLIFGYIHDVLVFEIWNSRGLVGLGFGWFFFGEEVFALMVVADGEDALGLDI